MSAAVTWANLDWAALDRLRARFLSERPGGESYWATPSDLANYDFTYAQRIGWKWEAVLNELKRRPWTPPPGPLLDWGCGSGIAHRCVLDFLGTNTERTVLLFDQSPLATAYATTAARRRFPAVAVQTLSAGELEALPSAGVLLVSHVLNELDEAGGQALRRVLARAEAVLWVEPGTFADSRALIAVREELQEHFHIVAPCTHQAACGLLAAGNERHWCHHWAPPPAGIMADANWVRFAQRAGIDLRSLPYSFLVLERKSVRARVPATLPEGWSRVIGRPRVYKGFAKLLGCSAEGVDEVELQKRVDPGLFKALKADEAPVLWRWVVENGRIVQIEGETSDNTDRSNR